MRRFFGAASALQERLIMGRKKSESSSVANNSRTRIVHEKIDDPYANIPGKKIRARVVSDPFRTMRNRGHIEERHYQTICELWGLLQAKQSGGVSGQDTTRDLIDCSRNNDGSMIARLDAPDRLHRVELRLGSYHYDWLEDIIWVGSIKEAAFRRGAREKHLDGLGFHFRLMLDEAAIALQFSTRKNNPPPREPLRKAA
jgi:hypothetical protein